MKILSVTLFLAFAVSVCLAAAGPKWSKMTKQPEEMGAHEEDKPMQIYKPDEKPEMRSGQTGFDAREGMKEVVAGRELPGNACVKMWENTDFNGYDLGALVTTNSWQECDELCQKEAECKYWSWDQWYCYVKASGAYKGKTPINGIISGAKECSFCTSDEFECICRDPTQCREIPDQMCLPISKVNDGEWDCEDKSDESKCATDEFDCSDGGCKWNDVRCKGNCIPYNWFLDGEVDCVSGADEPNLTSKSQLQSVCNQNFQI